MSQFYNGNDHPGERDPYGHAHQLDLGPPGGGGFQEIFNDLIFDDAHAQQQQQQQQHHSAYNTPSDVFQSPAGVDAYDYASPGELFSPLASPLLEGSNQQQQHGQQPQQLLPSTAASNSSTSVAGTSRLRGNKSTTPVLASSRVSKVSPMIKPKPPTRKSSHTNDESGLPDIVMPPPSRKASNASLGTTSSSSSAPATPSTLMNLRSTTQSMPNTTNANVVHPDERLLRTSSSSASNSRKNSPAIHPKISPKISPSASPHLGPTQVSTSQPQSQSNGSSSDLAAFLSSKSNYQTIVEGRHNELGLSYPEHLSANLTSKKTNHKLAEQGRRNRMNTAVSELGKLVLPKKDSSSATASKAHTVETAIQHIKALQAELENTKKELQKYKDASS
jgi:hypothetical protein